MEGEGGLVPVVPVGDQELRVGELAGERVPEGGVEPPEARDDAAFVNCEVRLAEAVDLDRRVPEQEDRLELRSCRAQQAQAALLRPCMRALVWKNDAVLVRLDAERRHEALALPLHPVGADVALREPPVRRLGLLDEHARLAPRGKLARGGLLVLRERQVDDVVRALREIRLALTRRDDVVGRRDEDRKRTCGSFGVAKRSKRTDRRHEADATKRAPVARTSDARRRNEPPTTERVSATSGASDVAVAREAARRFLAAGPMRGRRVRVRV